MSEYRDVWEYRIKKAFEKKTRATEEDIIWEIVSLILYQTDKDGLLVKVYKLFENKTDFIKLISLLDGQRFNSPTKKEVEETLLLAILYYEKEINSKSWSDIKSEFDFNISSIKYGIRIKNMDNWLKQKIQELLRKEGYMDEPRNKN